MMENRTTITIGLVDDQVLFRKGMKSILDASPEMTVILEASGGKEALALLAGGGTIPNILLLDLEMPEMNGVKTIAALQPMNLNLRTIILSVHNEPRYIARMVEMGACGFLQKNAEPEDVKQTIRSVHRHGFYLDQHTMSAMREGLSKPRKHVSLSLSDSLTKREKEILTLICKQLTTQQIATKLFLSERTVEGHRLNLLQKTDSRNSAGLAVFAIQHGLFDPLLDD